MTSAADPITVLVRYTVSPEDQAELLAVLKRSAPTFREIPGFRSLEMQRALNGTEVVVTLRWRSKADSDACFTNPVWFQAGHELMSTFVQNGRATMLPVEFEPVLALEA